MLDDSGMTAPESRETLAAQQMRLVSGRRSVQMFPVGTAELPIPNGMQRTENRRGVFHYDPARITAERILQLSSMGRENEFLELGPYSKTDIAHRFVAGEQLIALTEYNPDGVEVRAAIGTHSTAKAQLEYFDRTKDDGNIVIVGRPPMRVIEREMRKAD